MEGRNGSKYFIANIIQILSLCSVVSFLLALLTLQLTLQLYSSLPLFDKSVITSFQTRKWKVEVKTKPQLETSCGIRSCLDNSDSKHFCLIVSRLEQRQARCNTSATNSSSPSPFVQWWTLDLQLLWLSPLLDISLLRFHRTFLLFRHGLHSKQEEPLLSFDENTTPHREWIFFEIHHHKQIWRRPRLWLWISRVESQN